MEDRENEMSAKKASPISSLLMNFPRPPSEMKDYHMLSTDGSDALQHPPSVFHMFDSTKPYKEYFREQFAVVEALARTSLMTSPAAKRRIAARKIEINNGFSKETEFEPPKELLMYLVRMGSFNSSPKIYNVDSQDDDLKVPQGCHAKELLHHFQSLQGGNSLRILERCFLRQTKSTVISEDITDGLRVLRLDSISRGCSHSLNENSNRKDNLRILQWNLLSQSLGQHNDGFIKCPDEALTWDHRKFLIVEEILQYQPDIMCLQEVDHYNFLEKVFGSVNYNGFFYPKPDSPCLYIEDNNGPDGCAIFFKADKYEMTNFDKRILEVWGVLSNQVAIIVSLKNKKTGKEFCVVTTHLKARNGALLSKLRNEQGKDLLKFVKDFAGDLPVIMCGDFNAEPIEPIYQTVLNYESLQLSSAYADINIESKKELYHRNKSHSELSIENEPPYTTWKIREEGEVCHTIDYVFYSKNQFKVINCLMFPDSEKVGKNRAPSLRYPSDHFSLVCDFEVLLDDVVEGNKQ